MVNRSIGNRFEVVAIKEAEIDHANNLYKSYPFDTLYVMPELVSYAAAHRFHVGGRYLIYALVDYPDGLKFANKKFHGTQTDFFLTDGFDIVLSPVHDISKIRREIVQIIEFVKKMVSNTAKICLTLNRSLRTDDELKICIDTIRFHPVNKIKLEASVRLQPTKANFQVHSDTMELIGDQFKLPVVLCGNINKKIYKELNHKLAVSPQQMDDIIQSL